MSDVQNDTVKAAETPAAETTATQQPEEVKTEETTAAPEAPAAESSKPEEITNAATETKEEAAAPAEKKKDETAKPEKKPVEPITEGQAALKGPGLLKSIIPSKKEFWMSDDAVSPQNLNFYMRGEKPEISHPVVAWASQTGKGLLFFNKKGETARKQPGHVIALYDVTDLRKQPPHEITFKLHGQEIVMKTTSDNERDGWFMSLEKGIEIAKAQKEEIRENEGYKAELEKLNKPITFGSSSVAASHSQAQPAKSTEADKAEETKRKDSDLEDDKKDKKSRSNSRGIFERLNRKKDDSETKKEEKKDEKEEKKEDSKPDEDKKAEEGAAAGTAVVGAAAVEGATSEGKTEDKKEETTEEKKVESKPEEKPKPTKRGSIFGKIQGLGGVKSPSKEKEQKDAELKPEVPPKDAAVSENPPQLPEPETATADETAKTETETKPEATEEKKDATTPGKEKNTFLAGIPFINKRNRSVSPSTPMKEAPAKAEEPAKTEEAAPAEVPKEAEAVEEGKTDEAVAETTAVEPLKPEEAKAEKEKENKRQSVLGNLGRRASKAFKGIQAPKKENVAPVASTSTKEETTEAAPAADKPVTNGETKPAETQEPQQQIGDVVPDAVNVGKAENQPPTVTASA